MEISYADFETRYHGKKWRCAVVRIDDLDIRLRLADTTRCAQSLASARDTLRNLAPLAEADPDELAVFAPGLQVHCRGLIRWVEKPKRDVQRQTFARRRRR